MASGTVAQHETDRPVGDHYARRHDDAPWVARASPVAATRPARPLAASRHIVVGVSDPSNDPTRHRTFEIHAFVREADGGWIAEVAEQNQNAQPQAWRLTLTDDGWARSFPTAAACLGHAVEVIVMTVAREATD